MPSNQKAAASLTPAHQTATLSIEVEAPIWRVYHNWRRLDQFPKFVPFVHSAEWRGDQRLYWCEEHEGQSYAWDYAITTDVSKNSVSWVSLSGPENFGAVVCEPLAGGRSRLTMTVSFVPDQALQTPAAMEHRHAAFLRSFRGALERGRQ